MKRATTTISFYVEYVGFGSFQTFSVFMRHRNIALAHRLNGLMVAKGWTQSDLARQLFGSYTDPTTGYVVAKGRDRVSSWVTGKQYPKPANLRRLALAFGMTVDELVPTGANDPIKGYFIAYW